MNLVFAVFFSLAFAAFPALADYPDMSGNWVGEGRWDHLDQAGRCESHFEIEQSETLLHLKGGAIDCGGEHDDEWPALPLDIGKYGRLEFEGIYLGRIHERGFSINFQIGDNIYYYDGIIANGVFQVAYTRIRNVTATNYRIRFTLPDSVQKQ